MPNSDEPEKESRDLLLGMVDLHEAHLNDLEDKLKLTNMLLTDLLKTNIWISSIVTDAIKKKFQSEIHHHENVLKSDQHQILTLGVLPHDVIDGILNHSLSFGSINFASDLFQITH
jgi:hypothetical protein